MALKSGGNIYLDSISSKIPLSSPLLSTPLPSYYSYPSAYAPKAPRLYFQLIIASSIPYTSKIKASLLLVLIVRLRLKLIVYYNIILKYKNKANTAKILKTILKARAINIYKNYYLKQVKFITQAIKYSYLDSNTIIEEKLISFFIERVFN